MTSLLVARKTMHVTRRQVSVLCERFLDSYVESIQDGKAHWTERDTSNGLIKTLPDSLRDRNRKTLLDRYTIFRGGQRTIRLTKKHALNASADEQSRARAIMAEFIRGQHDPRFFGILDVARRVAGTGSLGLALYVILVEGKGSPNQNYLLNLKRAMPSALGHGTKIKQPRWNSEAQRIVTIQKRTQAVSMAFLHSLVYQGTPFVLRALPPVEDRVSLDRRYGISKLGQLIETLGRLVA